MDFFVRDLSGFIDGIASSLVLVRCNAHSISEIGQMLPRAAPRGVSASLPIANTPARRLSVR
jgi:hypothetical protein